MKRLVILLSLAMLASAGCGNEYELIDLHGNAGGDAPDGNLSPDPDAPDQVVGDDDPNGGNGCTLTQGYWKNHEEWPVTSLILGQEYSQSELLALLKTDVSGDASMILAHQLIAALLNVANGAAQPAEIAQALDSADQWMVANADADGRLGYGVGAGDAHSQASSLADVLADFNEGAIGPGHCE